MRVLLCLAGIVCLAILAFSVADVQPTAAQTTVGVALSDISGAANGDTLVLTGEAAGSEDVRDSNCWTNKGFSSTTTSPGVIGILTQFDSTGGHLRTIRLRVLTNGRVRGRLTNFV